MNHEEESRELKKQGKLCSVALHEAFSKDTKISNDFPMPRSIDGKCGALLTALKILDDTGHGDKKEEFEKEFVRRFRYSKCLELMRYEARCEDYVGQAARMLDEILNEIKD